MRSRWSSRLTLLHVIFAALFVHEVYPAVGILEGPTVQILHPLEGQSLAAEWQNVLIASIERK